MAALLASKVGAKLVMFNPALNPVESLKKYVQPDEFTLADVQRYATWDINKIVQELISKSYGATLYVTDDPVIEKSHSISLCKGNFDVQELPQFKSHRLEEEIIIDIRDDIVDFKNSMPVL